ncbi:PQQ-binding-like beta-propeller repeat protein [Kitasatospora gansuensis]
MNVLRDNGRWTLTAPRRTLSRPAVWGDRVYVLVDGHAAALDRADGSVLWRSPHRVGGELESRQMEFTATGGHLVVPSDRLTGTAEKAGLSVLDAGSGALCWQSDAGPLAAYHTDRRTLVTVHRTGIRPCRITALDLATGTRLWQREVRSLGTAVLAAGRLITFGEDEQGYGTVALDLRSGAERWRDTHFTTMLAVPPAAWSTPPSAAAGLELDRRPHALAVPQDRP